MSKQIKEGGTDFEVGGTKVTAFTEIDIEWFKDKSMIHYICQMDPPRPGIQIFCAILEYKYFPPQTEKNKDFIFQIIKWGVEEIKMLYAIASIPVEKKAYAEAVAKVTGMRIANGVPTLLDHKGQHRFPVDVPNAFTIENEPGHPIYKSSHHAKGWAMVEATMCEMIYKGHGNVVENKLNDITKKGL